MPSTQTKTQSNTAPKVETDFQRYLKVGLLSVIVFGAIYAYLNWLAIPGTLNKTVADTSVIFICLSMLLSSICYFWNFADPLIVYRKHLGLVGFAYAFVHLILSAEALKKLVDLPSWQSGAALAPATATVAMIIFSAMALISNNFAAKKLGGAEWRGILRLGYLALVFGLAHVAILKMSRWVEWLHNGMQRPPAPSLLVSLLIIVTLLARLALAFALSQKKTTAR